jgi:hypothetical protein
MKWKANICVWVCAVAHGPLSQAGNTLVWYSIAGMLSASFGASMLPVAKYAWERLEHLLAPQQEKESAQQVSHLELQLANLQIFFGPIPETYCTRFRAQCFADDILMLRACPAGTHISVRREHNLQPLPEQARGHPCCAICCSCSRGTGRPSRLEYYTWICQSFYMLRTLACAES